MISNHIQKVQRLDSFHERSHFEVTFTDGSVVTERDSNWSSFSAETVVRLFGVHKRVMLCVHPIKSIKIVHNGLETHIDVPEGCQVYQAFKSRTSLVESGKSEILGRTVGLVRDGEIIEERFLNATTRQVVGIRNGAVKESKVQNRN